MAEHGGNVVRVRQAGQMLAGEDTGGGTCGAEMVYRSMSAVVKLSETRCTRQDTRHRHKRWGGGH